MYMHYIFIYIYIYTYVCVAYGLLRAHRTEDEWLLPDTANTGDGAAEEETSREHTAHRVVKNKSQKNRYHIIFIFHGSPYFTRFTILGWIRSGSAMQHTILFLGIRHFSHFILSWETVG